MSDGLSNFTPPPSGSPKPSSGLNGCFLGCGGVLAIIAVFAIGASINAANGQRAEPQSYEAVIYCENAIKDRLKAPTTAEFSSRATGSNPWTVTGTVDSENSFGAMVRAEFGCTVSISEDTHRTRVDYITQR